MNKLNLLVALVAICILISPALSFSEVAIENNWKNKIESFQNSMPAKPCPAPTTCPPPTTHNPPTTCNPPTTYNPPTTCTPPTTCIPPTCITTCEKPTGA